MMAAAVGLAPLRHWLLSIVLSLFALVSSIPSGTMPMLQADGFSVIICTQAGPVSVQLDVNGEPASDKAEADICAWSLHASASALPVPASIQTEAELTASRFPATSEYLASQNRPANQNRPRAPPYHL